MMFFASIHERRPCKKGMGKGCWLFITLLTQYVCVLPVATGAESEPFAVDHIL